MFPALALLLLLPLAALLLSRRGATGPGEPVRRMALRMLALLALGLATAAPFLTSRGVGTGEAYNYSLAVADAVTQMRAGQLPPLVGQTEFAFNGRVHPLRTAPYLFYLAGGLDAVTGRSLTFWELQNLSLAFSLVAFVFATYGALRRGAGSDRSTSFVLTVFAAFCPALLNAGSINLFMTVHAAPFLPLAAGACLSQARHPSIPADLILGAALGLAWLAHPPVALWATATLGAVRLAIVWRRPSWQARSGLLGGLGLGALLAAFAFASSSELVGELNVLPDTGNIHRDYVSQILANLRAAFPGNLLPVSLHAGALADFQLGYALWMLLGLVVATEWRRWKTRQAADTPAVAALAAFGVILLLLTLSLPVPGFSRGLWNLTPTRVMGLTNIWPQQRLYLVAAVLIVFAAGIRRPHLVRDTWAGGRWRRVLLVGGLAWAGFQGMPFILQGFAVRWGEAESRGAHLGSNLDLTITSYAYLTPPDTFMHGVRDPLFEFRLVRPDQTEVVSNLSAARAVSTRVAGGQLILVDDPVEGLVGRSGGPLELAPGRKYLLAFRFAQPDLAGTLTLRGQTLRRIHDLQAAGGPRGFGPGSGQEHSLPVWTSLPATEQASLALLSPRSPGGLTVGTVLAEYELLEVNVVQLPIRLESLAPLRVQVTAPEDNLILVTPRAYLPGYTATVDHRPILAYASRDRQVAVPLQGRSGEVEIRYPGSRSLHVWFWISAGTCAGLAAWLVLRLFGVSNLAVVSSLRAATIAPARWAWRHRAVLTGGAVVAAGLTLAISARLEYLDNFGPIRIRFLFPTGAGLAHEPILSTGRARAGTVVVVEPVDDGHIRVNAEIWGTLLTGEPVAVDRTQVQEIVVSSSALYPLDHPRGTRLSPSDRLVLRGEFRVELNGHVVLRAPRHAFESTVSEVRVGRNTIGSSHALGEFHGRILDVMRVAPPVTRVLPTGRGAASLEVTFAPAPAGLKEPLAAFGSDGEDGLLAATRLAADRVRLTHFRGDGTVAASQEMGFVAGQAMRLELLPFTGAGGRALGLTARLDGEPVFGLPDHPTLDRPVLVIAGANRGGIPGVASNLAAGSIQWRSSEFIPGPAAGSGRLRLLVMFPRDKPGRNEPLVTTGATGRGDFAYVTYLDGRGVRLGLDHWGVGGAVSDPIVLDYDRPHEIEVSLGSFYPDENDPRWGDTPPATRRDRLDHMVIRLDGREVLRAPFAAYRVAPPSITVGENAIGGSSTDPLFTGAVLDTDWGGLPR